MTSSPSEIQRKLSAAYPDAATELTFSNSYQLIVAVVLSAQCTDKKVNQVTPELFSRYPDFAALSKARLLSLERILRPVNYYKTKSKHLKELARIVENDFAGSVPREHADLLSLPGVGRKTANVVLGELGVAQTIPVDTHVFRLAHRLGLSRGKSPAEVEQDLMKIYPASSWRSLHHQLILHGRRICKAQRPLCEQCSLVSSCPYFMDRQAVAEAER